MRSDELLEITDTNFDTLAAQGAAARAHRLHRRLVRALPHDRARTSRRSRATTAEG